jgi:glycosyltransferase involved in cell wall biosynthesis
MLISVILPTFNNEKTIFNSICSILNQSYKKFELIIINDCSTDQTKKIIKLFQDSRIIYIENKNNLGRSESRNKGIKISKGNFIAVMDGDDISLPNRFNEQINFLINNPKIDLVASNIVYFTNHKITGISNCKFEKQITYKFFLRPIELPHVTWMARRNFFLENKYNKNLTATIDQDILYRTVLSYEFSIIEEPLVLVCEPEKNNKKYKLIQIYNLFISRLKFIYKNSLFHFFPMILGILIISFVFYFFNFKTKKINFKSNQNYQKTLNKMINENS